MLPGTTEYQVNIRFFEAGHMRRFESPVWAHSFVAATLSAEKLLYSHHPAAAIMAIELVDIERKKRSVPRLIVDNPNPHPTPPKGVA